MKHLLSDTGVHPDPEKVKAITYMSQPTDVKSLQRFLEMVDYLSKFIQLQSTLYLFIYLGLYVTFNTVQVISRWVVGRAEETSTYSSSGFCTVN